MKLCHLREMTISGEDDGMTTQVYKCNEELRQESINGI